MRQHRHPDVPSRLACAERSHAECWRGRCLGDRRPVGHGRLRARRRAAGRLRGSPARRAVLRSLGAAAALGILDSVMPLGALQAMAEDKAKPEKTELTIGFIDITCATPLCVADKLGLFRENGLDVELVRTPSWAVISNRLSSGAYEASHVLTPQPLAMTLGIRGAAQPTALSLVQNTNGDSLTLALSTGKRSPELEGHDLRRALRDIDAGSAAALLPRRTWHRSRQGRDHQVGASARNGCQHEGGILDSFLAPDNAAQLAVYSGAGFIHLLSKEIWDGHPCRGIGLQPALINERTQHLPGDRARSHGGGACLKAENRKAVAGIVAEQSTQLPARGDRSGADRRVRRRLGNHWACNRIDFRPFLITRWRCGC